MGQAASSALAGDEVCFHRKGTFTVTYSTENSSSLPDTATVTGARGTRAQEGRSNVSGGKLVRGGSPVSGQAGARRSGPSGNQGARADREQVGTAGRRHLLPMTSGLRPDPSAVCSSDALP